VKFLCEHSILEQHLQITRTGPDLFRHRFEGILTLTRLLNRRHRPADVQRITRIILLSLFPAWLLPAFKVMFARPLPTFSKRLNAAVTAWSCQWLMVRRREGDLICWFMVCMSLPPPPAVPVEGLNRLN